MEERRFACGGGDADGQGSERQETSEPIALVDLEKEKKILAFAAPGQEGGFGGGRGGEGSGGSGRGSNGRKKGYEKFILLLVPPFLHIRAPGWRNFVEE